jgi:hypothetical protein
MPKKSLNGTCEICKASVSKAGMKKHLQACLKKFAEGDKSSSKFFHVLAEGYGLSGDLYWMHLKALSTASFRDLDQFLRDTWLECCGHMSAFYPDGDEVNMREKLGPVLRPGLKFLYEYDFGSTTELRLTVISELSGKGKGKVQILARNDAPSIKCSECEKPAATICTECIEDEHGWLCDGCAEKHDCDSEMFLPLVNSPRAGVCGYEG